MRKPNKFHRLRKYDIDLYGCFVCYYKEKILEQKKLQNKLYPKKTGKSIVLQKFTHPGPY